MGERGEAPSGVPFDAAACLDRLVEQTAAAVRRLRRRGAVVAVSGGVDSGVVAGDLRAGARPRARALPAAARARRRRLRRPTSALELAEALGARTVEEPITAALEGLGCYRRRDDGDPRRLPRLRAELAAQARPLRADRRDHRLLARRRAPRRRPRSAADAARRLPRADLRDEHEAARAQADRVHLGRPARLRGRRHAQPARVRPGVLRQGRRRAGRRQADRAASTRARSTRSPASSGCRRRSPRGRRRPRRSACPRRQEEFYFGHPYERMDLLLWGHARWHRAGRARADRSACRPQDVETAYWEIERRRVATRVPATLLAVVVDAPD